MKKIKIHLNIFSGSKNNGVGLSKINPHREWKIIVAFFIIFLFVGLFFDYQIYNITESGGYFVDIGNNSVGTGRLNTSGINNVIKYFWDKKIKMESLKKDDLIDPSL